MQPRNMSMSGVVDLAAVKAAGEAKQKAEQARAEAARTGAAGAGAPPRGGGGGGGGGEGGGGQRWTPGAGGRARAGAW
ncbi:hypothetical protein ACFXO2_21020, partial [Streptomyces sp. NPDC059152]